MRFGGFAKDHWQWVFPAIGLVLFTVRYASYMLFYEGFGVSPGDVGLAASDALIQAILATTLIVVVCGLLAGLIAGFYVHLFASLLAEWVGLVWDGGRRRIEVGVEAIRNLRLRFCLVCAGVAVLAFQVSLLGAGWHLGNRAEDGHPLGEEEWFPVTFSDWQADRVTVRQREDAPADPDLVPEDCTFDLGSADGIVVIWNFTDKETVDIPASAAIIKRRQVQEACPSAE